MRPQRASGFPDEGFAVLGAEKVGRDDENFVGAGAGDFAEPVLAAGRQSYEGPLPGKSPGQGRLRCRNWRR